MAKCFRRVLWMWLLLAVVSQSGCANLSGLRQSIFRSRECTVPAAELSKIPPPPAAKRDFVPTQPPRNRVSLLSLLQQHPGTWQTLGESLEGRPIDAMQVGSAGTRVLLIGGIHGDEPEGLPLTEQLAEELATDRTLSRSSTVLVLRNLNPDGTVARTRTNKNGVDLNRNFPASNWDSSAKQPRFNPGPRPESEPETRLLVEIIREFQPDRILVMHATRGKPMVNYDGPARELAESMGRLNGYVTSETIGYPTPGSLGTYAGIDQQIPIITLELPRGISSDTAWQSNGPALRQFLR